jgi:hypothetical protein
VRIAGQFVNYRLLFASEGKRNHVFLLLVAFTKKTQKTPLQEIYLAQIRLKDWRKRGIEVTLSATSPRKYLAIQSSHSCTKKILAAPLSRAARQQLRETSDHRVVQQTI